MGSRFRSCARRTAHDQRGHRRPGPRAAFGQRPGATAAARTAAAESRCSMSKQYTSSAHWPEDPNKVRALADALMVLAEDAIDHGVSTSGWPMLAEKLQ